LITFGPSTRDAFTAVESSDNGSTCNQLVARPPAYPGPYGSFNWAFHREAIALVTRPLALPNERMGVMADVAVHNDYWGPG
jgi:hypothetical protein